MSHMRIFTMPRALLSDHPHPHPRLTLTSPSSIYILLTIQNDSKQVLMTSLVSSSTVKSHPCQVQSPISNLPLQISSFHHQHPDLQVNLKGPPINQSRHRPRSTPSSIVNTYLHDSFLHLCTHSLQNPRAEYR